MLSFKVDMKINILHYVGVKCAQTAHLRIIFIVNYNLPHYLLIYLLQETTVFPIILL